MYDRTNFRSNEHRTLFRLNESKIEQSLDQTKYRSNEHRTLFILNESMVKQSLSRSNKVQIRQHLDRIKLS